MKYFLHIMKFKKECLSAVFSLLLLSACSSASKEASVPVWVLNPEQDNSFYFYSVGVADSLEQAKQNALKEMASKFSVKINSDTFHKQSLHNGKAEQLFTQSINSQVQEIEFSQVEQKKAEKVNHQFFVEIALSRLAFAKSQQAKLSSLMDGIDKKLHHIETKNKLEKLYIYNNIQEDIQLAKPLLYLITVADNNFDLHVYNSQFQDYFILETELLASTNFYIQSSQQFSPIVTQLRDLMQTYGFQISSRNRADAIIELKGSIKNSLAFSIYNTRLNLTFLVKSKQGKVSSKENYLLNGASVTGYESAYHNSLTEFFSVVEARADIYQLLGLSL